MNREDSENAIIIAVSLLVEKLELFFNLDDFSIFQLFLLLPKSLSKIPPDGAGKQGTSVFEIVISSQLFFQN